MVSTDQNLEIVVWAHLPVPNEYLGESRAHYPYFGTAKRLRMEVDKHSSDEESPNDYFV